MNYYNSTFEIKPDAKRVKRGGRLRPIRKTREGTDARLKQDLTKVLSKYVSGWTSFSSRHAFG